MSTSRPTVFGGLSFGGDSSSPTLFAESFIPQTYSVPLADAVTGSEAELFRTTKSLADSLSLTEAQIKTLTKALADSETMTESITRTINRVLAETGSVTDANVVFFTIKQLSDFLILKEWISIRLNKSITWVNPSANANIFDTLYGKYKFGTSLFGGLKPLASWSRGATSRQPSVWTNANGHKYNS